MSTGPSKRLRLPAALSRVTARGQFNGDLYQNSTDATRNDRTSNRSSFGFPFKAGFEHVTSRPILAGAMAFWGLCVADVGKKRHVEPDGKSGFFLKSGVSLWRCCDGTATEIKSDPASICLTCKTAFSARSLHLLLDG
ncbi:hypothetical protein KC361_g91 [Hortaea werneckii]|nr:hypothetical protein KC361_g91 [Hortaea werneckii]